MACSDRQPTAKTVTTEQPSLLDLIVTDTVQAGIRLSVDTTETLARAIVAEPVVGKAPEPKPEPKPVPAKRETAVSRQRAVGFKRGDYVMYTSKRGTTKRYKVVAVRKDGTAAKLQMLGHFRGDRLKGKTFWAKTPAMTLDTSSGGRVCTVCGSSTCRIGPFANR